MPGWPGQQQRSSCRCLLSLDHELRMQRAGRLDSLQDGDDALRLHADMVQSLDEAFKIGAAEHAYVRWLRSLDRRVGFDLGLAIAEWLWLNHHGRFRHAH